MGNGRHAPRVARDRGETLMQIKVPERYHAELQPGAVRTHHQSGCPGTLKRPRDPHPGRRRQGLRIIIDVCGSYSYVSLRRTSSLLELKASTPVQNSLVLYSRDLGSVWLLEGKWTESLCTLSAAPTRNSLVRTP